MKMNSFLAEWFELECILNPSVKHEKAVDTRKDVDWGVIEQSLFGAAICSGCAIIEKAGRKGQDFHTKNLFELRNAFVHNGCDIAKNFNKNSLFQAAEYLDNDYLDKELHKELPVELDHSFYSLNGSMVLFNAGVFFAIRVCLQNA